MPAFRARPEPGLFARAAGSDAGNAAGSDAGRAVAVAAVGTTAVGVVIMVAGTFAPWLASGSSTRNLYGSAGVVQRLAGLGSTVGLALDAVPLTGLYCVLAGVIYVLGRRRIAAGAIALLALVLGSIAGAALAHRRTGSIHLLTTGPACTLFGAVLSIVALGLAAAAAVRRRQSTTAAPPAGSFPARPVPEDAPVGPQIQPTTVGRRAEITATMEFR